MWRGYRLRLKLIAPLHIGWRTVGNLRMTRRYVPGSSLWGAMACRLARDVLDGDYMAAGDVVDRGVRFSYLFLSESSESVNIWPWGERADEFSWRHMHSYASTALADGRTTLEGSLHETEYLSPSTREHGRPVWLHGYYWIDESADGRLDDMVKDAWSHAQFGAERSYGWGRVSDSQVTPLSVDELLFGRLSWASLADDLVVRAVSSDAGPVSVVLAHVRATPEYELLAKGFLEPLVSRLTAADEPSRTGHFGRTISMPIPCWGPGTLWDGPYSFAVGPRGLWQPNAAPVADAQPLAAPSA
jgi:hypothetical protein